MNQKRKSVITESLIMNPKAQFLSHLLVNWKSNGRIFFTSCILLQSRQSFEHFNLAAIQSKGVN